MGRAGPINSGGASSGSNDLVTVRTAVINKRAGGTGLILGRKAFQKPMKEGVALLHAVQDVYDRRGLHRLNRWYFEVRGRNLPLFRGTLPLEWRSLVSLLRMFLVVLVVSQSGCMYRMGAELAAGMFDESTGERKSKGMDSVTQPLVEKAIVRELGRQLGQGLTSGIGTVSDEQRASLEATVDGILATATSRTGRGLREDVSPELREMIRKDVIGALSEGLQGELGSSLEETVEKVINKASRSLVQGFQDPDLRIAISESLRDAVYMAVREGDQALQPLEKRCRQP